MSTPHTTESLLALTKSPEGLEQLRIIAAELDGWKWLKDVSILPNYPTSLDAIFAAEERLGLHDTVNFYGLCRTWASFADALIYRVYDVVAPHYSAFLPPSLRLIPFILTAQWKEQNQ